MILRPEGIFGERELFAKKTAGRGTVKAATAGV